MPRPSAGYAHVPIASNVRANDTSGVAQDETVVGDVLRHARARSNHGVVADGDPWEHDRPGTDDGAIAHPHLPCNHCTGTDRCECPQPDMMSHACAAVYEDDESTAD